MKIINKNILFMCFFILITSTSCEDIKLENRLLGMYSIEEITDKKIDKKIDRTLLYPLNYIDLKRGNKCELPDLRSLDNHCEWSVESGRLIFKCNQNPFQGNYSVDYYRTENQVKLIIENDNYLISCSKMFQ